MYKYHGNICDSQVYAKANNKWDGTYMPEYTAKYWNIQSYPDDKIH